MAHDHRSDAVEGAVEGSHAVQMGVHRNNVGRLFNESHGRNVFENGSPTGQVSDI